MRLTVRTNLAMRVLMFCAVHPGVKVRKRQIAESCNASEAHLGMIINQLSQTGFIETMRGRGGGIRLACPPADITVGRVFRVFEADTPFTECFAGRDNHCPITPACRLRGALSRALNAFYAELDQVTLSELVEGNTGLERILQFEGGCPVSTT
ncbi:Rrf2 family transcriptional regulator [Aestuariibius sp. HNIBRBA575]|uniref:RrF2 family transcriptional regulator n=1 Tax=Aestuariibius sp. HNIBRBA575 TaxID=3233343 RepID=UPI0034A2365D